MPIPEPNDSSPEGDRQDEGVQLAPFEGDFFGSAEDYQDHDFPFEPSQNQAEDVPQVDDSSQGVAEVDDDDDDDADDEEIGLDSMGGEAPGVAENRTPDLPPRSRNPSPSHENAPDPDAGEQDGQNPPPGPGGARLDDHEQLRRPPVYVHHFGGQAGEVIRDPGVRQSDYNDYARQVPGTAENPYAPFASRLDWEVAEWAKLRGPSATAFSELLKIQGVRTFVNIFLKSTHYEGTSW